MPSHVVIDFLPESMTLYGEDWAVVAVDVIRATTTAVTAVSTGRRCFPVGSLEDATLLRPHLDNALLAGELGGAMPYGFEENNSPAAMHNRTDVERPLVLLSTSGTQLLADQGSRQALYAACLRNVTATVEHLVGRHERVALIGAGTRGEFREEDQMCCAWIAEGLLSLGFRPRHWTADIVRRWHGVPVTAVAEGASARYLRASGQGHDLDFVLSHNDDLREVYAMTDGQLLPVPAASVVSR